MPLTQQWNSGFQRQLPLALTLEVNYVGNHTVHLSITPARIRFHSPRYPLYNLPTTAKQLRIHCRFPISSRSQPTTISASPTTVRRQFNTRFAVLSTYTYAKSMDDGSTIYNFSAPNGTANSQYPVDNANRIIDMAPSNIDVKHVLNIAIVYTTPGPWWLRNWHISPVFVGHTGLPYNITQTNEIPGASQRPNGNPQLIKLAHPFQIAGQPSYQYFDSPQTDPNFPLTPSGPVFNTIGGARTQIVSTGFGNVSRDSNRVPGEVDFDASVAKDFKIFEALNFQFRVDAFNVINHTNFQSPSTSPLAVTEVGTTATFATSSSFGKITGTQPNRTMQASARFFF
jgi:hypothetical protein